MRLSLNYPNGRSHVVEYEGPEEFRVGQEFELYGRRWRVAKIKRPRLGVAPDQHLPARLHVQARVQEEGRIPLDTRIRHGARSYPTLRGSHAGVTPRAAA